MGFVQKLARRKINKKKKSPKFIVIDHVLYKKIDDNKRFINYFKPKNWKIWL